MTAWRIDGRRWVRSDGAVVKWDDSSPWPNPASTLHPAKMWTAWEPDPSEKALYMQRGRTRVTQGREWKPGFPRRWKTAEAAMRAVDKEYPLAQEAAQEKP